MEEKLQALFLNEQAGKSTKWKAILNSLTVIRCISFFV
jgi:hypothetical protein